MMTDFFKHHRNKDLFYDLKDEKEMEKFIMACPAGTVMLTDEDESPEGNIFRLNEKVLIKDYLYITEKKLNNNNMAVNLFYFLVFPGLMFAGVVGAFLSWFDRKITARVQFRKGPPLLQPFYDFFNYYWSKKQFTKVRIATDISPRSCFCSFWCNHGLGFHSPPVTEYHNRFQGDLLVIFTC